MYDIFEKGRCVWQRVCARVADMRAGPEEARVHRRSRHRHRRYVFPAQEQPAARWGRRCAMGLLACVMLFSLYRLVVYTGQYIASREASRELRALYYQETPAPARATDLPAITTAPASPTAAPAITAAPSSSPTAPTTLPSVPYPDNPHAITSSRFSRLQRQNEDIIGWLNIPDVLDEAVVQRDNSYYLRRDYRGYHNDNGALFLDENCILRTRPYTLMVYGHNMKSGAMFGCLRNYENVVFYRSNAFVTFDTAYEDGRYVIFAVGTLTQDWQRMNFVDVGSLLSMDVAARNEAIGQLRRISEVAVSIEVKAEDQLLLLITCVGDETERRFVAARRLRPEEDESQLQELIRQAYQR